MMIELHATEIELIKRMLKIINILKLESQRYTIQLGERITICIKLYNPTVGEHNALIQHGALQTKTIKVSQFSTVNEWNLYEFTFPGMRDD
jgi:predicted NACHT family NTPase